MEMWTLLVLALVCSACGQEAVYQSPLIPARAFKNWMHSEKGFYSPNETYTKPLTDTNLTLTEGKGEERELRATKDAQILTSCNYNLRDLPQNLALMLTSAGNFPKPDKYGKLSLKPGETLRMVCPGKDNKITSTNTVDALVKCRKPSDKPQKTVGLGRLICSKGSMSSERSTNKRCEIQRKGLKMIEIGFSIPGGKFKPLIDICFDVAKRDVVYAKYKLIPMIQGSGQWDKKSHKFKSGVTFQNLKVEDRFSKKRQRAHLRLEEKTKGGHYLQRGHLAARADFIYAAQQRATYWYVNVAPQWASINNGNWKALEQKIREYAANNNRELTIYSGTDGVTTINEGNQEHPVYLIEENNVGKLKVPKWFWKVLYEPSTRKAVAFIGLNDPFKQVAPPCNDVCSRYTWLKWEPKDQRKGLSFCCDLNGARRILSDIPNLAVSGLL